MADRARGETQSRPGRRALEDDFIAQHQRARLIAALAEETIVGGIFWVLYQRIVMGRVEEIEGLLPELAEFSLTPYLGAAAAKRVAEPPPAVAG